jgi:hypothetical protein
MTNIISYIAQRLLVAAIMVSLIWLYIIGICYWMEEPLKASSWL